MSKIDLFFEQHEKKFYVALAVIMAAVFCVWHIRNSRLQNLASAYISLQEGNYGKAIGLIENPKTFQEYLFVSYAYLNMGYLKDEANHDQLTDIFLKNTTLKEMGKFAAFSAKEGYEAASAAAYQAKLMRPDDPRVYILMAFIAAANRDFNMAQDYAGEALQHAGNDTQKSLSYLCMAFVLGRKAIKLGEDASYNQAVIHCRKSLYFDPKKDLGYQAMGVLMILKKKWAEAVDYFKEAENAYYLSVKNSGLSLFSATDKDVEPDLFSHISLARNKDLMDYAENQNAREPYQEGIPKG